MQTLEAGGATVSVGQAAIRTRDLKKRFGAFEALKGVDLTVEAGTIYGLLGPNGAGKSTLLKALVGASRPSSGEVRVLELDPVRQGRELRPKLGYMPQSPALYDDLSARDNIRFFAQAHHLPDLQRAVDDVLEFVELRERQHDPVFAFSGGMRQRVSLACALVHRPQVLFLDEPTAGVDPKLKEGFWRHFRDLASQGVTLFISTHLMDEALLCSQLTVLRGGEVLVTAPPEAIMQRGRTQIRIWRGERMETEDVRGYYVELPRILRKYGLDRSITRIELHEDALETVIVNMIEEAGR